MGALVDLLHTLTTPEGLIRLLTTLFSGWTGYALLSGIILVETGLLVGMVLPGDSFLFTVGMVAGVGQLNLPLIALCLIVACLLGDNLGYTLGRSTGQKIFNRQDSKLFKQEYVRKTHEFFERHGGKAILYARFVPVVRSFTPFMAGVGKMPYQRFLAYSFAGGVGWVIAMTGLGYVLGSNEFVRRHFEKVIILIVLLSVTPILLEYVKSRRSAAISAK